MPQTFAVHAIATCCRERHDARLIQAVRHRERLRMIGDRDVLVAERPRASAAISSSVARPSVSRRVHVEVAANVADRSVGQPSFGCGFDLAAVLAQLRRNPVQAERCVDFFLGLARDTLVRLEPETGRTRSASDPARSARCAQRDVVVLAAGEVLHGRADSSRPAARAHPPGSLRGRTWRSPCSRRGPAPRGPREAERSARARLVASGPVTSRSRSPTVSRAAPQAARGRDLLDAGRRRRDTAISSSAMSLSRNGSRKRPELLRYGRSTAAPSLRAWRPCAARSRSFCSWQRRSRSSIVRHRKCSNRQRDALRPESLNLQQFERVGGILRQQLVALGEAAALENSPIRCRRCLCRCRGCP